MPMFSTYLRLNLSISDSNIAVIRAAWRKLDPRARHDRAQRLGRHNFYRTMLDHHQDAQDLATKFGL